MAGPTGGGYRQAAKRVLLQIPVFPRANAQKVVATLAALYLLHTKFQEWESEWHLSAAKAERSLEGMKIPLVTPKQPFNEWLTQVTGENNITRVTE